MNKLIYVVIASLFTLFACSEQPSQLEIAQQFYAASNSFNFSEINNLTCDTVTIIDGDYRADYDKNEYYTLFQWDSVFNPNYKIEYIEQSNNEVFVKLATTSLRFAFLKNNPLVTTHRLSFINNKIRSIELTEYVESDFNIWVEQRDSLVNWINIKHPELNGFIYDMTKTGAENYLKAIALQKDNK